MSFSSPNTVCGGSGLVNLNRLFARMEAVELLRIVGLLVSDVNFEYFFLSPFFASVSNMGNTKCLTICAANSGVT